MRPVIGPPTELTVSAIFRGRLKPGRAPEVPALGQATIRQSLVMRVMHECRRGPSST